MLSEEYIFLTLPRMGTKHVQDQLVRALEVTDVVEGCETFLYKGREFRFSLGEYFLNYGFDGRFVPESYFEDGHRKLDHERKYARGLPSNCYAFQIYYDDGWRFAKRDYINYYRITDRDFREKWFLLNRFGKSYVIKVLFDQHSIEQLREILRLTPNVVCYVKPDLVNWLCSYAFVVKYWHSNPSTVEPTALDIRVAKRMINYLNAMINFCEAEGVPVVMNRGQGVKMFGQEISQFVTPEFSEFGYEEIITNYGELLRLVKSVDNVFSKYTPFLDVPPVSLQ